MSTSAHESEKSSEREASSLFWRLLSNFFRLAALKPASSKANAGEARGLSPASRRRRIFPAPPRDYLERRRIRRRISNAVLIPLLSIVTAYFIARPTGGSGFSRPKSAQQSPLAAAVRPESPSSAALLPSLENDSPSSVRSSASPPLVPTAGGAYKLADGPHSVTEVPDTVLHDAKRDKILHVRVFYPNEPGSYPVIVFSHGAGGSQSCCDALTRHWATHGYVTIQPTHEDSTVQRRNAGEEDVSFLKAVRDALKKPSLWQSRPQDISFVLDSLPAMQKHVPALTGKMDLEHIGVGGHSMGAFTADAIAGALVDLPGHPATSFADPRVKAVVLLSPQGPGEFGLTDHSWDGINLPLLSMTGSLDLGAGNQGPEWKKIPFERSKPGGKYHVFIQGANHMSFVAPATMPGRATQGDSILGYTNCASLAFWDAYLKTDPDARNYLQSDALPQFSRSAVKLSRR